MSKTVDQKVVEMRFDNKQFERNVNQTLSTLDKLKAKLKLTGASKGLENLNSTANKVNMSGLSNAVNTVSLRFSALEIAGITALSKITNAALNAGTNLVKALSVDNIYSGWAKLQQKANSMSTLISQGYNTEVVEKQLEKLNWFSDETSYNFTDMIDNIAKFTATGKGLEDSVTAMEGIALWAAKSGQNASKASAAMYQLSQALGAGFMRKEDWKSIQNYSMDTDEFRQAVLDTAIAMGTLKKVSNDTYRSLTGDGKSFTKSQFAESLTQGQWFTSDVMMSVYKKYAKGAEQMKKVIDTMSEDYNIDFITTDLIRAYNSLKGIDKQGRTFESFLSDNGVEGEAADKLRDMISNLDEFGMKALAAGQEYRTFTDVIDSTRDAVSTKWMGIFETILGNIDEQKEIWTTIGENFYEWFAEPLNEMQAKLTKWVELGGRDNLFESLSNIAESIGAIIKPVKEAFREIFPKKTAEDLANITKRFNEFTKNLKISEETANKIKTTFKGLFSGISIGINFVKNLGSGLWTVAKALFGFSGNILDATSKIGEFLTNIKDAIFSTNVFGKIISGISNFVANFVSSFSKWLKGFGSEFLPALWNTVKSIIKAIYQAIGRIFSSLGNAIQNGNAAKFIDLLNKGLFSLILLKIKKFLHQLTGGGTLLDALKSFVDSIKGIADSVAGVLNTVKDALKAWQHELQAKTLLKIAGAVGILALSLVVLSDIDKDKLKNALSAITTLFINLVVALKVLEKGNVLKGASKYMGLAISLSLSVLILASALKKIATLNTEDLIKGVIAITIMVKLMSGVMQKLATDQKRYIKGAAGIIAIGVAIRILVGAVKELGAMNLPDLAKGVVAVGALIGALGLFIRFSKTENAKMVKTGLGIILLAASIKILASACKNFAEIEPWGLARSLGAIAALLIEISAFSAFTRFFKKTIIAGIAMNIFALAIKQMVEPIRELSKIDETGIDKALSAIMGVMTIFTLVMAALTYIAAKGGFMGGMNMTFAAGSIKMLTNLLGKVVEAFQGFSKIDDRGIIVSIVSIVAAMTTLVVATKMIQTKEALQLMACVIAINILAKSLALLGNIGLVSVGIGVLGLAGAFIVLTMGAKALKPLIPTLFKIAGAIATLSGSLVLLGLAIGTIGLSFGIFAASLISAFLGFKLIGWDTIIKGLIGIASAFVIIGVAAHVLKPMIGSIFALAGAIAVFSLSVAAIGVGISLIVQALSIMAAVGKEGAEAAGVALKALVSNILELIPIAVKQLGLALMELLIVIRDMLPLLGEILIETVKTLINVLITCAPDIVKGFFELIVQALTMLNQYVPTIANLLFDFMINVLNTLSIRLPEFVTAIINFLARLFDAVVQVFSQYGAGELLKAVTALGVLTIVMHLMASLIHIIPQAIGGILIFGVLITELAAVIAAVGKLSQIPGFKELVTDGGNFLQIIGTAIGQFVGGIVGGISKGISSVLPAIANDLSDFIDNLQPFIKGIKAVDLSMLEKIGILSASILALETSGFISGIISLCTKFTGTSLKDIGKQLSEFIGDDGIKPFLDALSDIDPNVMYSAEALGKAMLALTTSNLLDTITKFINGEADLSEFANKIGPLGKGIKEFASNLGEFKPEEIETIRSGCEALKVISEAAGEIPKHGGIKQAFTGDNDLSTFAGQLKGTGASIRDFVMELTKDDVFDSSKIDVIRSGCEALKILAESAGEIPKHGGIKQAFTGDNDISTFAGKLGKVAEGVRGFVWELQKDNVITNESIDKIHAVSTILYAISSLGQIDISEASSKLEELGARLISFANKITEYIKSLSTVSLEDLQSSKDKIDQIINIANTLAEVSSEPIEQLGERLKNFATDALKKFTDGLNDEKPKEDASNAMKALIDAIIKAMDDKKVDIDNSSKAIIDTAISALKSADISSTEQVGKNFVQGFANGINNNLYLARDAGSAVGKKALDAAKQSIDSHSPSKETYKLGTFFDQGFVNGIKAFGDNIYKESYSVGDRARIGLSKAIKGVSDLITNGIDDDITIRPILDLSNVESGISSISGMFNNPSLGVSANLNAISSGMRTYRQNGGEDVISAIDRLGKNLGNTSGDTYNINGITYDNGTEIQEAVSTLVRAARIERRT